ncbi:MAG: nucleotidyltransferase domain-containing protein [Bacteroidetes bacterium]|nr:MAG: nucleotidyltransferase domain-containing protein [Bacteroidota bacterium]
MNKKAAVNVASRKYNPREKISRRAINSVVQRIISHYDVEKIILFGSYAYGNPMEGSDVDILVVMNHNKTNNRKQMFEISRMLAPREFPMDIIVRTPNDIQTRIPQGDWFLKDIVEKGLILFDRTR